MLEEMFPKETDHECDTCKKFQHVLPEHETCSQTNSIKLLTLPTKIWKCEALGCAKIVKGVPPFYFTCIQALVDP